jgi:CheY-like chemotaxis protein
LDETDDATTALNRIARQSYDAIILDIELQGMDGITCAKEIRKLGGKWSMVPLIALTGHTEPEFIQRCMSAGFTRYLPKPVRKEAIIGALKECITDHVGVPIVNVPDPSSIDPAIQELVPNFLANRKRDIGLGRNALASGNFSELRRIGHNLKGTGPTYGFPTLGALGARIEKEAKEGNAELLAQSINELESLLSELVC